jgi:hypothetical protein
VCALARGPCSMKINSAYYLRPTLTKLLCFFSESKRVTSPIHPLHLPCRHVKCFIVGANPIDPLSIVLPTGSEGKQEVTSHFRQQRWAYMCWCYFQNSITRLVTLLSQETFSAFFVIVFCCCQKLPLHAGTALLIAPLPYPFCVLRLLLSLDLLPRRVLGIAPSYKSTPAKCTQTLHACRAWQVTP